MFRAGTSVAANAQQVLIRQNSMERTRWYQAPRELQILDERPTLRDFRTAPQMAPAIALPPGPGGARPGAFGNGAGALGDSGPVIDGMHIGGGRPYRLADEINPNSVPLEKTGFDRMPSNIPAAGIHPAGTLPKGYTTGVMGRKAPGPVPAAQPQRTPSRPASPQIVAQNKPTPRLFQYSPTNDYGSGVGSSSGSSQTKTQVIGILKSNPMTRLLDKVSP